MRADRTDRSLRIETIHHLSTLFCSHHSKHFVTMGNKSSKQKVQRNKDKTPDVKDGEATILSGAESPTFAGAVLVEDTMEPSTRTVNNSSKREGKYNNGNTPSVKGNEATILSGERSSTFDGGDTMEPRQNTNSTRFDDVKEAAKKQLNDEFEVDLKSVERRAIIIQSSLQVQKDVWSRRELRKTSKFLKNAKEYAKQGNRRQMENCLIGAKRIMGEATIEEWYPGVIQTIRSSITPRAERDYYVRKAESHFKMAEKYLTEGKRCMMEFHIQEANKSADEARLL